MLPRCKFFHQQVIWTKTKKYLLCSQDKSLSGQIENLAVVECDYVCKDLREVLAVLGVNGNELAGIQRSGQPLQVCNRRVSARVRVDKVDCRVAATGGDSPTAEVVGVVSVQIAEPLRVDDVDGSSGVLEFINKPKTGHLAEVEKRFGSCVQFSTLDPVAIESLSEISKVVWVGLEPFVLAVRGENSYLGPVHGRRILSDLPELFEHPCRVNVDDEESVGSFARPIGGDNPVYVLRGRQQERDVLLLLDCLEDYFFDCGLVREVIVVAMQHGAFKEENIDVANRALHEILEELSLSAMRAKIAAVEQALAFRFDKEGVGIGGGVVDQIGSDGELTPLKCEVSQQMA
jgi:hypothetical protein